MKSLILSFTLFFLGLSVSCAQQSVTVTQQGHGNSVTIKQSAGTPVTTDKNGCNRWLKKHPHRNKIVVRRVDGTPDTLVNATGRQKNIVNKRLGKQKLAASQYGQGNQLSIVLPDSQTNYTRFKSTQVGSQNKISATLNHSIRHVALSQAGKQNKIAINPCSRPGGRQKTENNKENNSVTVSQKGNGNSAVIIQH